MPDRMWSLSEFRFDSAIEADEVCLDRGTGQELVSRDEPIAFAHERRANLVAWWRQATMRRPRASWRK